MKLFTDKLPMIYETLRENNIDLWIIIGRETEMNSEPVLPALGDMNFIYGSILGFSKEGKMYASISIMDHIGYIGMEGLDDLERYETLTDGLANMIRKVNPKVIALNYNENDPASDGLTAGMMIKVQRVLKEIDYQGEVVSSFPVASRVRSYKNPFQIERITDVAVAADRFAREAGSKLKMGMTCVDLYNILQQSAFDEGYKMGWLPSQCPAVWSGPNAHGGHIGPKADPLLPGNSAHIDYGVSKNGYCSDIQRAYYFLKENEDNAPDEFLQAFYDVRDSIAETAAYLRPGMTGRQVDAYVRECLKKRGRPHMFGCGLGHQVGFVVHDGGPVLAYPFERYDRYELIDSPIHEGYVFTMEPGFQFQWAGGSGIGIEEMIVVREDGGHFLTPRQMEPILVRL